MNYLRIAQSIALVAISLQIVACSPTKDYSKSDADALTDLAKKEQASDYEYELEAFHSEEYTYLNQIHGEQTPDAFKKIKLSVADFVELDFKKYENYGSTYVKFIDELNIHCDGTIEVTDDGKTENITMEKLLLQGKWRALRLGMCGKITIPEGRKLLIHAKDASKVQDLEIATSPNSLVSFQFINIEYTGTDPKVSLDPKSILKLYFF